MCIDCDEVATQIQFKMGCSLIPPRCFAPGPAVGRGVPGRGAAGVDIEAVTLASFKKNSEHSMLSFVGAAGTIP